MNHGTTERDLPYVEDRRDPLLGNDRRGKTCGRIVMGPRTTEIGRAQSELQSHHDLVCRLLLEKKKKNIYKKNKK